MDFDLKDLPGRWRVTLESFMIFLTAVKRSDACPVCPHTGDWNFYIDNALVHGTDAYMMVTLLSTVAPESRPDKQEPHAVFTMECPNCGHLILTSTETVARVLELKVADNG